MKTAELRFRSDVNRANNNHGQEGFNRGGVSLSISAGGAGGGEKTTSEPFDNFLGGGKMKDWLMIMIVVVVGLTFLTHKTGIPGISGPNGGMSVFSATGHLLGMICQWLTFFLANPALIILAIALRRSPTLRKIFPFGWIHPSLGLKGFCDRFERLGESSLAGYLQDPVRMAKTEKAGKEIKMTSNEAEAGLKDSPATIDALRTTEGIGAASANLASAENPKDFADALDSHAATVQKINPKFSEALKADAQTIRTQAADPQFVKAWELSHILAKLKETSNNCMAEMPALEEEIQKIPKGQVESEAESAKKLLAFFCSNPPWTTILARTKRTRVITGSRWPWQRIKVLKKVTEDPSELVQDQVEALNNTIKQRFPKIDIENIRTFTRGIQELDENAMIKMTAEEFIEKITNIGKQIPSFTKAANEIIKDTTQADNKITTTAEAGLAKEVERVTEILSKRIETTRL